MKSLILKKHDVDEEFDEAYELSTDEDVVLHKEESTISSTLMTLPGIYIIISFLIFISLYFIISDNTDSTFNRKKFVGSTTPGKTKSKRD